MGTTMGCIGLGLIGKTIEWAITEIAVQMTILAGITEIAVQMTILPGITEIAVKMTEIAFQVRILSIIISHFGFKSGIWLLIAPVPMRWF